MPRRTQLAFDLILYGGPGSGKSTIAELIAPKLHLYHFSGGQILRELAKAKTPLGREIKSKIETGHLIGNRLNQIILDSVVSKLSVNQRIVFDGFPRTRAQAEWFDKYLRTQHRQTIMIYLDTDTQVLLSRLSARGRADDKNRSALKSRLATFRRNAKPILNHYRRRLIRIDANGTPAQVVNSILDHLQSWHSPQPKSKTSN